MGRGARMTDDRWDQILSLLEEIRDTARGEVDPEKGKIFWPIKEGDFPSVNDAYATLYDLSDAEFCLSFYDETGNKFTDELSVVVLNMGGEDQTYFWRSSLKDMLSEELQEYIDDDNAECRPARLLARLIKAFDEP
jgi:hypothetical protein